MSLTTEQSNEHTMRALVELLAVLSQSADQPAPIAKCLELVVQAFNFAGGALYLFEEHSTSLALAASSANTSQFNKVANQIPTSSSTLLRVLEKRQAILIEDKRKLPRTLARAIKAENWDEILITPLYSALDTLGLIFLGTSRSSEWIPENLPLLTTFGQQIGLVLQNTFLRDGLTRSENQFHTYSLSMHRRNIQMQLAVESASLISTIRDPQMLLQHTANIIKEKFNFYYVGIFLVDEDREFAVLRSGTGKAGKRLLAEEHKLRIDLPSMISWCITHCQPRIAQQAQDDDIRFANPHLPETRAEMSLPLKINGESRGALTVQSTNPGAFLEEDIQVMVAVADQLAIALENSKLIKTVNQNLTEISRRNELIQALNTVSARLQITLDSEEVIHLLGEELNRIGLSCLLGQLEGDEIAIKHIFPTHTSSRKIERFLKISLSNLRIKSTLFPPIESEGTKKHAFFLSEVWGLAEKLLPGITLPLFNRATRMAFGVENPPAIYLPLVVEDRALGILSIIGEDLEESDLSIFSVFASQVAASLEIADLHTQLREQRQGEQAALLQLSQALLAAHDPITIMEIAVQSVAEALNVTMVSLMTPQEADYPKHLVLRASVGGSVEQINRFMLPIGKGSGSGYVFERGEPLVFNDLESESRFDVPDDIHSMGLIAGMVVPMQAGNQVIGIIGIACQSQKTFGEDDQRLLTLFANTTAQALERARLFQEEQAQHAALVRSTEFINALSRVAAQIQNTTQIEQVFDVLGREFNNLDLVVLAAMFAEDGSLKVRFTSLELPFIQHAEKLIKQKAAGFKINAKNFRLYRDIVEEQEIVFAQGAEFVEITTSAFPKLSRPALNRLLKTIKIDESSSAFYLPLPVEENNLGMLVLWGSQLQEGDVTAAQAFSSQLAIAIHNTILYERVQEHAQLLEHRVAKRTDELNIELGERRRAEEELQENIHRLELLNTISSKLSTTLDVNELSIEIIAEIKTALGVSSTFIGMVEFDVLNVMIIGSGGKATPPDKSSFVISEESSSGWVVIHNEGLLISDTEKDARFNNQLGLLLTQSELVVPIRIANSVLGVLGIGSDNPDAFDVADLNLLQSIADHFALALENAKSFQRAQTQRDEAAKVAEIFFDQTNQVVGINRIVTALQGAKTLSEASRLLVKNLHAEFSIEQSILWMIEEESLCLSALWGLAPEENGLKIAELEACPAINQAWRKSLSIQRSQFNDQAFIDRIFKDWLIMPIQAYGEVLGLLVLEQGPLDGDTLNIIINQAGLGLASARSYEQLQKQARQLAQTNIDIQRATQAKTDFMNRMSHELRTPLNAILGFSRLLSKEHTGPLNSRQQRYIENILSSSMHQLALVNDILDLAKVEAGKIELYFEKLSLAELFENVCEMIFPQANAKSIAILIETSDPTTAINADPIRFRQILLNLLSNAVKFTPDNGRVTIDYSMTNRHLLLENHPTISHRCSPDIEMWILIAISDSGIGIKEEDYPRVFAEFEQIDSSLARTENGTGLGLALSKHLVEAHGGIIWFESVIGEGTTFYLVYPAIME